MIQIVCANCGQESSQLAGAVNRARKNGRRIFCGRACAGVGRRTDRPSEQKRAEKREYDALRRIELRDRLKAEKAAYFKRTYDPVAAAEYRKQRMPYHVEYCRKPEYRASKSQYDRSRRAAAYGPFADAYLALLDIDREVNARMSDYDVRVANGTLNKRLQRRRQHEQFVSG